MTQRPPQKRPKHTRPIEDERLNGWAVRLRVSREAKSALEAEIDELRKKIKTEFVERRYIEEHGEVTHWDTGDAVIIPVPKTTRKLSPTKLMALGVTAEVVEASWEENPYYEWRVDYSESVKRALKESEARDGSDSNDR